ncbi:TetR family transcriptional regulator [Burkholderia multivorans]|jgi:AcrR family transcriptional regulator|uniref:TetR family transcriptional regulator n=1 Tax=Burkholderia TaxID=32008 RepID=UPI000686D752|nr:MULTISPECIES: TetR family transcriptional regulator [Burkholderia]MBU9147416.1 TetR family transcriptional regulator [Burkholderia multivorans]HEF4774446.1 TetR family transcriptional regulator [Burkholderia multivorans]
MARKTKEKALLTRESIVDAGERLFVERGVRPVSLEEIAESAGVTRGALYWHFSGKGDLLLEIFVRLRARMRGELIELTQCRSRDMALRNVTRFCRLMLSDGSRRKGKGEHIRAWITHYEIFLDEPLTARLVGELFRELHEALADLVLRSRGGAGGGGLPPHGDSELDAFLLQALLVGYAKLNAIRAQPRHVRATAASIVNRGVDAISSRSGSSSESTA